MPSSPCVSLAADVHRHHRAQALARRVFAASEQQCAQRAGGGTQHDIVDLAAKRRTELLHLLELDVDGRESVVSRRSARSGSSAAPRSARHGRAGRSRPASAPTPPADASARARRRERPRGPRRPTGERRGWMREPCVLGLARPTRARRRALTARAAPGSASSSRSTMSTEPTPSTRQWWVFHTSAQRLSARPSSSTISHSGRLRSRRCE